MVLLLLQQAFRDKQRHRNVLMTGLFKFRIQDALDIFPDCIAVWAHNHAAFDRGVVAQLCLLDDIGIPFCKVDVHRGDVINHFLIIGHCSISAFLLPPSPKKYRCQQAKSQV